jgi:hypothetical protein
MSRRITQPPLLACRPLLNDGSLRASIGGIRSEEAKHIGDQEFIWLRWNPVDLWNKTDLWGESRAACWTARSLRTHKLTAALVYCELVEGGWNFGSGNRAKSQNPVTLWRREGCAITANGLEYRHFVSLVELLS